MEQMLQQSMLNGSLTVGGALPDWITYNAASGQFTVKDMPANGLPLKVMVKVGDKVVNLVVSKAQ